MKPTCKTCKLRTEECRCEVEVICCRFCGLPFSANGVPLNSPCEHSPDPQPSALHPVIEEMPLNVVKGEVTLEMLAINQVEIRDKIQEIIKAVNRINRV